MAAAESTGGRRDADFSSAFKVEKAFCSSCAAWELQGSGMYEGKAGILSMTQGHSGVGDMQQRLLTDL